jgi:hypothetical protein
MRKSEAAITTAVFLWMMGSVFACTYKFSGEAGTPFGISRINVEMFENRTLETGAESIFANDLIDELSRDGRMAIAEKQRADAVLTGVIKYMDIETVARKEKYISLERKVEIGVDLRLKDSGGKILWSADNMAVAKKYLATQNKLETEQNRRVAIKEISKIIAQQVYQRLAWEQ